MPKVFDLAQYDISSFSNPTGRSRVTNMGLMYRIEKFESEDGSIVFKFPLLEYEWESSQSLRTPFQNVSGAHYGVNMRQGLPGLKDTAQERIRFTIHTKCADATQLEYEIDRMRSKLFNAGLGKLWIRGSQNNRRWSWGQILDMPEHSIMFSEPRNFKLFPTSCQFRRESDWYGFPVITGEEAATTATTVTINNPGNAKVYNAVFVLRGVFNNPSITNDTNGMIMQTGRDGSSDNDRVLFNAGAWLVQFSSDGGANYADDYAAFVRQAGQTNLMILEPGDNIFSFTGVTSGTLSWTFFPAYH